MQSSSPTAATVVDNKVLVALLKGLKQLLFDNHDNILTENNLKKEIFGNISEEQSNFIEKCKQLLKFAAFKNFTPSEFREFLKNKNLQENLQELTNFLTNNEEQVEIFFQFYSQHCQKIHQKLVNASNDNFGNNLLDLKWRIDQQQKNINQLSDVAQTVAIVELKTKEDPKRPILFEFDRKTLSSVLEQFKVISQRIDQLS
ncbi:hypothetical protein ABK040_002293 [Willaertia magna]